MVTEYTMEKVNSDLIIIGASDASHGYVCSILEDSLNMTAYNCGKDGRGFHYQNAMINGILDRYSPKLILWSTGVSMLSTPTEKDLNTLSDLNPWYKENQVCHDAILMKSKYENIKMFSHLYAYNSKLFYYIYRCFIPQQALGGGYLPLYGTNPHLQQKHFKYNNNNVDTSIITTLNRTIERCKEQGTVICFVLTPTFTSGNYEQLQQYIVLKDLLREKECPFVTELFNDNIILSPEYFYDVVHLNYDGAVIFTEKLSQILKKQLVATAN